MNRPNLNCLFNTHPLNESTSKYLFNVYFTMMQGLMVTGLSCYLGTFNIMLMSSLSLPLVVIGFFLSGFMLLNQNTKYKKISFYLFSGVEGLLLSPLIYTAQLIDTTIIPGAISLTIITFITFTFISMLTKRRDILYLGSVLGTVLMVFCVMSIINLFLQSPLLFTIEIYFGLVLFCFYVIYDTQMVIQEYENGMQDQVYHAMTFYLDFLNIFIRILIILIKNSKKKKK